MKSRTIILLLNIFFCLVVLTQYADAQIVTFSGKAVKTGNTVKVDSVKIINLTNQRETVINSEEFNIDWFSSVNEGLQDFSDELSVVAYYHFGLNDEYKIRIFNPRNGMLHLTVFSSFGSRILTKDAFYNSGVCEFILHCGDLSGGVYFVSSSDGFSMKTAKLLINGNSKNGVTDLEYISHSTAIKKNPKLSKITGTDYFKFIGYSKGFSRCVIDSVIPENNKNYEFLFKIEIPATFTSGYFSISGFKGKTSVYHDWSSSDPNIGSGSSSGFDSMKINLQCSFTNCPFVYDGWLNCSYKEKKFSLNNEVKFSCTKTTNYPGSGSWNCTGYYIGVVLDTVRQMFSNFYIYYQNQNLTRGNGAYNDLSRSKVEQTYEFRNIPFTIDNNQNLIAEISDKKGFEYLIIDTFKYYYYNSYSYFANGRSETRDLLDYEFDSTGVKLMIVLNP